MRKSVTNLSCALAVAAVFAGPAAAHDKTPATVSPLIAVPQIAPALATRATVPAIAPVVPQQAVVPATARVVPEVSVPAVRYTELPRFDATSRVVEISRSGAGFGRDGRGAPEPVATKQITAKSDALATTATPAKSDTSTRSDAKVAVNTSTEAAAATEAAVSQTAPAPAPSCR